MSAADEVAAAAAHIVAAFGAHDRDAYFATFAPEATFLFHTSPRVLGNRAEYEQEWATWEQDGFRVLGCQSSNGQVHMIASDCAVFTHTVRTRLADGAGSIETGERETIVFTLQDGRWLGVHEHLSPDPNFP
jgi:ketosteroid isomerase-like protein